MRPISKPFTLLSTKIISFQGLITVQRWGHKSDDSQLSTWSALRRRSQCWHFWGENQTKRSRNDRISPISKPQFIPVPCITAQNVSAQCLCMIPIIKQMVEIEHWINMKWRKMSDIVSSCYTSQVGGHLDTISSSMVRSQMRCEGK